MERQEDAKVDDPLVRRRSGGGGAPRVTTAHRPDPRVELFEVRLGDYREFFFVAVGERSVSITTFDTSDETHPEPQTFTFARPYGWALGLADEEALLQLWQSVGVQR